MQKSAGCLFGYLASWGREDWGLWERGGGDVELVEMVDGKVVGKLDGWGFAECDAGE